METLPALTRCTVCAHPNRVAIEARMIQPGVSMRAVAMEFDLSHTVLQRHRTHLAQALEKARENAEIEPLAVLYRRIRNRSDKLAAAAEQALNAGNFLAYNQLMLAAHKHDESLLKLGERPGYRDQGKSSAPINLNAPDARIVVTTDR